MIENGSGNKRDRLKERVTCPVCKKLYTRKTHLIRHLTSVHRMSYENAKEHTLIACSRQSDQPEEETTTGLDTSQAVSLSDQEHVNDAESDNGSESNEVVSTEVEMTTGMDNINPATEEHVTADCTKVTKLVCYSSTSDEDDEEAPEAVTNSKGDKVPLTQNDSDDDPGEGPSGVRPTRKQYTAYGHDYGYSSDSDEEMPEPRQKLQLSKTRPQKAPIGSKLKCEICDKEYFNTFSLKRHMSQIHEVDPNDYNLQTTSRPCKWCNYHFSNLSKHAKHCKERENDPASSSEDEGEYGHEVPVAFNPGGNLFFKQWNKFLPTQSLSKLTQESYTRKLRFIVRFLEKNIKNFQIDSLLFPLDKNVILPSLCNLLQDATTVGAKMVAIKTYRYVCLMVLSNFDTIYASTSRFTLMEKLAFKQAVSMELFQISKKLKPLNNESKMKTQLRVAERMEDPNDLTYNPDKLRDVAMHIVFESTIVKDMVSDLTTLAPEDIEEKYKETEVRNLIISLLLTTGGGLRPGAVGCMKIHEFTNASRQKDGTFVAVVKEYKGFKSHGPQPIPFVMDNLYEATQMYLNTYRDPNNGKGYLFAVKGKDKAPRTAWSIDWLYKTVLGDVITEDEFSKLSPKSWRKMWHNLGRAHPSSQLGKIGLKVMNHSEAVADGSYAIVNKENASKFGNTLMSDMRRDAAKGKRIKR